ncbi:MAG: hypothetical protein LN415_03455 [Candidatus Thermoplasmatota archaeon]|nr:hypothetical protein [Candidatus Thermoplasmatota archaeon]MCJ2563910.1 hypothetical protein [Candidatus Thermoplasmatota archaeon]MCK4457908.1 hypothetical protein [Thermoplasmata archaeon]
MDALVTALVSGTVLFVALGILILFLDDIDLKVLLGAFFVIVGISLGLFALGVADWGTVVLSLSFALIVKQVLSHTQFY